MPHAVINTGALTATNDNLAPRQLIPGVQPGGQFAGREMKPALRLIDVFMEVVDIDPDLGAAGVESAHLFLKLSQKSGLDPGLILPVGYVGWAAEATLGPVGVSSVQEFQAQGTIWVPAYVGLRAFLRGDWDEFEANIHIEYELVMVPWMDWFIRWEFLDNVVNHERQY